jgi:glycosyltransferase involved in cell wall biosynthesis
MRVALVADTFCVEQGTGIARYSQELLAGLTSSGVHVEPIAPSPPRLPFGMAINHALKMPFLVQWKAGGFDLIHATSPITALAFPLVSKPKVVTYHDLISLVRRNTSIGLHTRLFAPLFFRIARYANRLIANSHQTKDDMMLHLGIPSEKISVVSWGISDKFKPAPNRERSSYVIGYLGTLSRRKGLPYLIGAIHAYTTGYPDVPVKLVVCGRRDLEYPTLSSLVHQLGLDQVVEFRGSVPDHRLVDTYNSFNVKILPSECEGFGLPILEAQRCGVPVIIREDARIPAEVSKCCLKASSEEDMADKIYELLTNAILRQSTIEEGLEYSQQFTWERTVRETVEVYEQILS